MSCVGCRMETEALDGPMNMAIDELLHGAAASGIPCVRFYQWSGAPWLSLGYFQDAAELNAPELAAVTRRVRRMTGGGVIVHEHDLSYALALPAYLAPPTQQLYLRLHQAFAGQLERIGIAAQVQPCFSEASKYESLCFERPDPYAVCVHGHKVLGSAQRRHAASVLIHGSLLIAQSACAPRFPGLWELLGWEPDSGQLADALLKGVEQALETQFAHTDLMHLFRRRAVELVKDRFGSEEWNLRRRGARRFPPDPSAAGTTGILAEKLHR